MAKKKTWIEKLNNSKDLPKVVKLDPKAAERWGGKTLAIPSPLEIDSIMKLVSEGKLITVSEIRKKVAKKHGADVGCPLTTGIFTRIAANAAEEMREKGEKDVTPWWRTLKSGGVLNEKFPSGPEMQKKILEKEGHKVVQRGKKWIVEKYEKRLTEL
jgi:alkylated DNA nucleotide flippase Atl1